MVDQDGTTARGAHPEANLRTSPPWDPNEWTGPRDEAGAPAGLDRFGRPLLHAYQWAQGCATLGSSMADDLRGADG